MLARSRAVLIALFAATTALAACGGAAPKPFVFERSNVTPAATGEVFTNAGPNGNTRVKLRVKHLAPPERIHQDATGYVVWATDLVEGSAPRNLGALRVDGNLDGSLETVTPLQTFDLTITAEPIATGAAPTNEPVLTVRISAK